MPRSFQISESSLELSPFDPSRRIGRVELEVLHVDGSDVIELVELNERSDRGRIGKSARVRRKGRKETGGRKTHLRPQLDVRLEELLLRAHSDRDTHDLLGCLDVLPAKLEVSVLDPEL